jgi:hypothetical protein
MVLSAEDGTSEFSRHIDRRRTQPGGFYSGRVIGGEQAGADEDIPKLAGVRARLSTMPIWETPSGACHRQPTSSLPLTCNCLVGFSEIVK